MIKKLFPSQAGKVKIGFWLLNPSKISRLFFYLLILFLPTQLGKHFWPDFSFVYGLRLDYLSPTLYFTDIFILLIFIFFLPEFFASLKKIPQKYLIVFGLFLLSLLVGLIGAKNFWAGIYGIIKFLEFSFLAYFVSQNYKSFSQKILFSCVLLSIIFESLLAFLQYFNQGSIGGIFYLFGERTFTAETPGIANASINGQLFLRSYATFSHPNVLAGFLVLAMLFLLLVAFKNKQLRVFVWLGIILGTSALLITLGRSAIFLWFIYLIFLFGLWLFEKYKKHKLNPLQVSLSILIFVGIVMILILQNNFILQRFLTTNLSDESLVQRQELITQSLNMFWKSPVLGVGINNYFNNLNFIASKENTFLIQPVHNVFLLALSETGLVGFCLLIFIFIKSFISVFNKKQIRKYLLLAIFAIIFLGLFDHYFFTLQQGQLLLSLVLGISFAKS
ncbi:MAG: O-antigen ligase family protein [Candidatus Levyibacteriota bacterium]